MNNYILVTCLASAGGQIMTYSEWCNEMQRLIDTAFSYGYGTIGSKLYVEKMAELSDEYPEYDERWENGEVQNDD